LPSNLVRVVARNNLQTGGKPCFDIGLELTGEKGRIEIVFVDQKCATFAQLSIGDRNYEGRYADLSMLAVNTREWNEYRIRLDGNQVSLSLGNRELFLDSYEGQFGRLMGISLRFFGSGQVQEVEIQDPDGKSLFHDSF
jgi:hypothetical protein